MIPISIQPQRDGTIHVKIEIIEALLLENGKGEIVIPFHAADVVNFTSAMLNASIQLAQEGLI